MRLTRIVCWTTVVTLLAVSAEASGGRPIAVSPGSGAGVAAVGTGCPAFSWSAVAGAAAYELVAYGIQAGGEPSEEVLRQKIAGAALSWTPELARCLAPGGRYAWTVRALDGAGEAGLWSEASLFEVAGVPSAAEIGQALAALSALVERAGYDLPGAGGDVPAEATPAERSATTGVRRAVPRALTPPDASALSVEATATSGAVFGVHGVSQSTGAGSVGVAGASTAASGDVAGVYGQVASAAGAAGVFDNTASGDILRGLAGGSEVFSVDGAGAVAAASFAGDGSSLTSVSPAAHTHSGGDIDAGTVAEARIDAAIARDGEVTAAVTGAGHVARAGDTMTGALALPADGLAVGTTQLVTSGGLVGIGTAAPTGPLHIANTDPQLVLEDTASGANRHIVQLGLAGGEVTLAANHIPAGSHSLGMKLQVRNAGAPLDALQILSDGKVGIGTVTPGVKVDVVGGQLRVSGAGGTRLTSIHDQSANAIAGVQGYGTGSPTAAGGFVLAAAKGTSKHISGVGDNDPYLYIQSDAHDFHVGRASAYLTVEGATGEVGIGTMSPAARLEVSSVLRLTPTDSPGTCGGSLEGAVYYDDSLDELCFCDGSSWGQADGGGAC